MGGEGGSETWEGEEGGGGVEGGVEGEWGSSNALGRDGEGLVDDAEGYVLSRDTWEEGGNRFSSNAGSILDKERSPTGGSKGGSPPAGDAAVGDAWVGDWGPLGEHGEHGEEAQEDEEGGLSMMKAKWGAGTLIAAANGRRERGKHRSANGRRNEAQRGSTRQEETKKGKGRSK